MDVRFFTAILFLHLIFVLKSTGTIRLYSNTNPMESVNPKELRGIFRKDEIKWTNIGGFCYAEIADEYGYYWSYPKNESIAKFSLSEPTNDSAEADALKDKVLGECCDECFHFQGVSTSKGQEGDECTHFTIEKESDCYPGTPEKSCFVWRCYLFKEPSNLILNSLTYSHSGRLRNNGVIDLVEVSNEYSEEYFDKQKYPLLFGKDRAPEYSLGPNELKFFEFAALTKPEGHVAFLGPGWYKIVLEPNVKAIEDDSKYRTKIIVGACGFQSYGFYMSENWPQEKVTEDGRKAFEFWYSVEKNSVKPDFFVLMLDEYSHPTRTYFERVEQKEVGEAAFSFFNRDPGMAPITLTGRMERIYFFWDHIIFKDGGTATTQWTDELKETYNRVIKRDIPNRINNPGFLAFAKADKILKEELDKEELPFNWYLQTFLQANRLLPYHRTVTMRIAEDDSRFNGAKGKVNHVNRDGQFNLAEITWNPNHVDPGEAFEMVNVYLMYLYYQIPFNPENKGREPSELKKIADAAASVIFY